MYKTVHRDKNHKAVKDALRSHPMVKRVFDTAALGDGYPDLTVVMMDGTVRLVEIKSDETSGAKKIANELDVMISLVDKVYRIAVDVDQAAEIVEGV